MKSCADAYIYSFEPQLCNINKRLGSVMWDQVHMAKAARNTESLAWAIIIHYREIKLDCTLNNTIVLFTFQFPLLKIKSHDYVGK